MVIWGSITMTKKELLKALEAVDDDEVVVCADEDCCWDNIERVGTVNGGHPAIFFGRNRDRCINTKDERLERALCFIRDKAKEYAQAKATRIHIMEFRKSKKAILMRTAELAGAKTAAAQEREAYANDEYVELLEALKVAVEIEEALRYQIKAAELKIEVWRTKESTRRAEMSMR
jgi:hypothetical protein